MTRKDLMEWLEAMALDFRSFVDGNDMVYALCEEHAEAMEQALGLIKDWDWQPMTTAPKDGTLILIYDGFAPYLIVQWSDDHWSTDSRMGISDRHPPLCWRQLTAPDVAQVSAAA